MEQIYPLGVAACSPQAQSGQATPATPSSAPGKPLPPPPHPRKSQRAPPSPSLTRPGRSDRLQWGRPLTVMTSPSEHRFSLAGGSVVWSGGLAARLSRRHAFQSLPNLMREHSCNNKLPASLSVCQSPSAVTLTRVARPGALRVAKGETDRALVRVIWYSHYCTSNRVSQKWSHLSSDLI